MEEGITENHAKAFLLNLLISGNYAGTFHWDDNAFKRGLVDIARASTALRPFVSCLLLQGSRGSDGKQMFESIRPTLLSLWLDAKNPKRPATVCVSDQVPRLANDLRHLLTTEQLGELRAHGPGFLKALAA